jgi:lipopolysaccharide/colanic/teichoic acid biosynthesis glycosyltransferase
MKRLIDIFISLATLIILSPVILIISLLIKVESPGPVFHRCLRVGINGKPFRMWKFRSMFHDVDQNGCRICLRHDNRVTSLGRILRKTKMNELPQLFQIILGDMSLVGPRPEDPEFIRYYTSAWEIVLSVRPGVFGLNQIINFNEEKLFPDNVDPELFYIAHLLPEKLMRDMYYVQNRTVLMDFRILFSGIFVTILSSFGFSVSDPKIGTLENFDKILHKEQNQHASS